MLEKLYTIRTAPIENVQAQNFDTSCTACPRHTRTAQVCVRWKGEPGGILLVSSNPSDTEARSVNPWTDAAHNMAKAIVEKYWSGPIAYDYSVRCTGKTHKITDKELKACSGFMKKTLQEVRPSKILAFGPDAMAAVLGRKESPSVSVRRGYGWLSDGTPVYLLPYTTAVRNKFLHNWLDQDLKAILQDELPMRLPPWEEEFCVVETPEEAQACVDAVRAAGGMVFDTETAGGTYDKYFELFALAVVPDGSDKAWVWSRSALKDPILASYVGNLLVDKSIRKTGHNIKYDINATWRGLGMDVAGDIEDTMTWKKYACTEGLAGLETSAELVGMGGHKLDMAKALKLAEAKISALKKFIGKLPDDEKDAFYSLVESVISNDDSIEEKETAIRNHLSQYSKVKNLDGAILPMAVACLRLSDKPKKYAYGMVDEPTLLRYCCLDAVSTARLATLYRPKIMEFAPSALTHTKLTVPTIKALTQIERWGMRVDEEELASFDEYLSIRESDLLAEMRQYGEFNPDSNKDLPRFLYEELRLPVLKRTGKEAPSTDAEVLAKLKGKHPVVDLLLKYRKTTKMRGTYASGMRRFIGADGRIHTTYNIIGARTGRLSSSEPNCFSGDTEILTDIGWVRFDAYTNYEALKVAQVDIDTLQSEFVYPEAYVEKKARLLTIRKPSLSFRVTPDHQMLVEAEGERYKVNANSLTKGVKQLNTPHRFAWSGRLDLSREEIIVLAALKEAPYLEEDGILKWEFKDNKQCLRVKRSLGSLKIEYKHYPSYGTDFIYADAGKLRYLQELLGPEKEFGEFLLDFTEIAARQFLRELQKWPCVSKGKIYKDRNKTNADWVQVVQNLCGIASFVSYNEKTGYYYAKQRRNNYVYTDRIVTTEDEHESTVYCVKVPKGNIIVRHNGIPAVTGNCQNIPRSKKSEDGKRLKNCFLAGQGNVFASIDFSQLELKVAAILSADPKMIELINSGEDYHLRTAKLIAPFAWGKSPDDILPDSDERSQSKAATFGLIYGMKDALLARTIKSDLRTAARIRAGILGEFKQLDAWMKEQVKITKNTGYTWTYWFDASNNLVRARRRDLFDIASPIQRHKENAENASANTVVQGTASDFMLASLGRIVNYILDNNIPAKVIGTVHDSVMLEIRRDYLETVLRNVILFMTDYPTPHIKLTVDAEVGPSWGSLTPVELAANGGLIYPKLNKSLDIPERLRAFAEEMRLL